MTNFTHEFYPNPFRQPGQAVPSPTDTPVAQANDYAPLPFHEGSMPSHVVQHQPAPQSGTNAISPQQAAITTRFDSMNNYRHFQAFTSAYNSGAHQQSVASTSGRSFLPFNGSVSGIGPSNQLNGSAGGGMAFSNSLNPPFAAGYNSWIQYPQDAMANGFNQLPPTDPSSLYFRSPILQQPASNPTHNHPAHYQQNPGPPFLSYQVDPMAQLPLLDTQQQQTFGYHQAIGVPGGAYEPEAVPMGQNPGPPFDSYHVDPMAQLPSLNTQQQHAYGYHQTMSAPGAAYQPEAVPVGQESFASYSDDAVDPLLEQRQRVTTHLPVAEGESASPAIHATGHTFHDASFPSHVPDAAAPQPVCDGRQAMDYPQQPEAHPPAHQCQGDMGERLTASNHNDATNASQDPRFITESPVTDEPSTPPDNAPLTGPVMVPGDVKEHNRDVVSPAIQMPVPRYPLAMFSLMADSPAAPSPVAPWVNEHAGPVNLHANSQQAAEIPAPQPVQSAIPSLERRPAVVNSGTSTPPVQKPLVFEVHAEPQSAGAGSSRKHEHEHKDEGSRPVKRARRSWNPRTAEPRRDNAATAATSSTVSVEPPVQNCTILEFRASMDHQIFYTGPPEKPVRKAPRKASATKSPKKASRKSTRK